MARESANLVQQISPETIRGTAVPATRQFAGVMVDIGGKLTTKQYRRHGAKAMTSSIIHKEWSEGKFDGPLSYVEFVYFLAGLFPFTKTTVNVGATQWDFLPNAAGNDDATTFTLEDGDDEAVDRYSYLTISSLDLDFGLEECKMSGNCFAQPQDASLSALSSPAVPLAERNVSSREVDVYMDDTFATIGTTKVTDAFEAKVSIGEKRQQKWVLNSSNQSWKEAKEIVPAANLMLTAEYNAQIRALQASLKNNPLKYFRIVANGPVIPGAGAQKYLIQIDFCGKVQDKDKQADMDGIYGYQYNFGAIQDAAMGRAYSIRVINALNNL